MRTATASLLLAAVLASCGGGSGTALGTVPSTASGHLRVSLSDSPVDSADAVNVTIVRVEAIRIEGGEEVFDVLADETRQFDLLTLRNDVKAVLVDGLFPAGEYAGLRLILARNEASPEAEPADLPNHIVVEAIAYPLRTPSAQQTGLKLLDPFAIREDTITDLTIDFNVRHSVVKLGRQPIYLLKPRLDLVATDVSGSVSGTVRSADPATTLESAVVSAQQAGAEVLSTESFPDGTFRLNPLRAGIYTLVVSAPGFAYGVKEGVEVLVGQDTANQDFDLEPSEVGSISGTSVPGDDTNEIHLRRGALFLALTGADPVTGEFAFEGVPVGTYEVVLIENGVETARVENVEVTAGADTGGITLGVE